MLDHVHAPFEQRGGVFGTARQILSFLRDPDIARWVTRDGPADRRPQLDLADVRDVEPTRCTCTARKGRAQCGGLGDGAGDGAVRRAASSSPSAPPAAGSRCPLVGVLDEAANICRWRQLPDLYSHYGSRGIPLLTLLQSWSQGAQVWGQTGMRKLWGACNVRVYGGGAAEEEFLSDLEKLIGDYNRLVASPSAVRAPGGGSTSTSWQLTPTPILTVADLAALPARPDHRHALRRPAGARGARLLVEHPAKPQQIRESIATYDPPQVLARRHAQPAQEDAVDDAGVSASQQRRIARRGGAAGRADRPQRA